MEKAKTMPRPDEYRTIADLMRNRTQMTLELVQEEIVKALYFRTAGEQIIVPDGLLLNILHHLGVDP